MRIDSGFGGTVPPRCKPWGDDSLRHALVAIVAIALAVAAGVAAGTTTAGDGGSALRDGNRAFHNGEYAAAISHYLTVPDKSADAALARYNLGVSYYHLGEYVEAERWLRLAAQDPDHSSRARYNLGLVYWARGQTRSARDAFAAAEKLTDSRQLRSLARQARRELERGAQAPALRQAQPVEANTGYSILTSVKAGSDDNVYRSPDAPYVDLARTGSPAVTPAKAAGAFAELSLDAQNTFWSGRNVLMRATYEFDGRQYSQP